MTEDVQHHTNHADESMKAESGGSNIRLHVVGFDRPILAAALAALVLSMSGLALIQSFRAEREARLAEYYAIDLEACFLKGICPNKLGVPVPADPWGRSKQTGEK